MWTATSRTTQVDNTKNSAASSNAKQLGMTSAISMAKPNPTDIQRTIELENALAQFNVFETNVELDHRIKNLSKLNVLFKKWITDVSISKNIPINCAKQMGGKIYTFGSYRLGVYHKGADIDALCVAPQHIERSHFFTSFFDVLNTQSEVTDLRAVAEAFVPVIKMNFDNIEIDLLFARLALKEIPDNLDLQEDMLLKNLDQKCVRSLNGCRVTDQILRLVPDIDNFKTVLRTIKLWAKKHFIYSNAFGYLGGVSWAMLVARTCQLYLNAAPATLVNKFFLVFSQWKWPLPVLLKQPDVVNLGFTVWDPRINVGDRFHHMPIITPAYPQQNSTYNVSLSTRSVIMDEIKSGLQMTNDIMVGRTTWDKLFECPNIYLQYRHFIVILATSATAEDHLEWGGLVESQVRHLIGILDRNTLIKLTHVHPECLEQLEPSEDKHCSMWIIGLLFEKLENLTVDLTNDIQSFTELVLRQANNIKMLKDHMQINVRHVKRKQLNEYVNPSLLKRERKVSPAQPVIKKRTSDQSMGTLNKKPRVNE